MSSRWLVERIRVLVANRPRIMRSLVRAALSDHPDIEVVGEVQDEPEILPAIDQTHADYLIIAQDRAGTRPTICDFVLEKYPHMKVLALARGREESAFYWISREIRSSQVETSEDGVLNALLGNSRGGEKSSSSW